MKYLVVFLFASVMLALPSSAEPVYDSDDMSLEGMLAPFKDSAEAGDLASMRQVYLHYGFSGRAEQAQAWAQKFLETLRERAEKGDVPAMSNLGRAYVSGDAVIEPNAELAHLWLSRASEAGDAASAYMLGELLTRQQQEAEAAVAYARAYGLFRSKAEQGDTEARYWQGFMELRGLGTARPEQPAATLTALVKEEAFLPAAYQLFKYAAEQEDETLVLTCARLLADKGQDARMAYVVADALFKGKGCEQDETSAERYLEQAVQGGVPDALYHRAWMKEEAGEQEEAFRLYSEAAAGGHAEALVKAGVMLLEGRGAAQDESTGLHYLQRADEVLHSPYAPWELGRYYDRIGESALADEHFITAGERGLAPAMARCGRLHLIPGSAAEWSPTEAYRWWKRGAEAGDADCTLALRLYLYGLIPLLVVLVFAVPTIAAQLLLRRKENGAES